MSKPLLLETIKIENGKIFNLGYHQARCNKSRKFLFGIKKILDLSSLIDAPQKGLYRCRILYTKTIKNIEYIPYIEKKIQTLKIIPSNIEYTHKYANREALNTLLQNHRDVDDIIIETAGYLSDTTIANIAFYDGKQWFTPNKPLLEGTMRAKLIEEKFLQIKKIKKENLKDYTHLALMNAMIGFKILKHINIKKL